jgi:hypothetical protein
VPSASSIGTRISFDYFGLYSTILVFFAAIYVSFVSIYLTLSVVLCVGDGQMIPRKLVIWLVHGSQLRCWTGGSVHGAVRAYNSSSKGKEKWSWWWIARIRPSGLAIFCFHSRADVWCYSELYGVLKCSCCVLCWFWLQFLSACFDYIGLCSTIGLYSTILAFFAAIYVSFVLDDILIFFLNALNFTNISSRLKQKIGILILGDARCTRCVSLSY